DSLRKYVGSGGGLVVVGGDASYDKGNYNNTPVEAILPIISRAAEFKGGRNIMIVIDVSGSTIAGDVNAVTGEITNTAIEQEDNIAANIAGAMTPDSNIGVIGFGGKVKTLPFKQMTAANKDTMKKDILSFTPSGGNPTNLIDALKAADDEVKKVTGSKEVIVLSDGKITGNEEGGGGTLNDIINAAKTLAENGVTMTFIQVRSNENELITDYKTLAGSVGGRIIAAPIGYTGVDQILEQPSASATPTPTTTPEISHEYPLVAIDTTNFITQYLNLTASVTGYNDITPKLGSDELVATTGGKPILTTWGFGLGRVVAFTTDNGNPSNSDPSRPWASEVYSGENSRLISSMINWAIGDPRPTGGVVIQAEDIWEGTPGKVVVTSNTLPQVKLDGAPFDLSRTGPTTYEATINLEKAGCAGDKCFHDLSGYGIAVNYPLEYRDVGFNDQLTSIIESNGGRVYEESEVEGLLLLDIKAKAVRTVTQPISQTEPFLLAALGLFLAEVIARRLKDYRKERPVIEDNPTRVATATPVAEPVAAE
ncbi:MAG: VWA domain-containing protein, partial [Candidatus Methanoperedens sp.]|nr:VWA domain-containing protein [Candidatus Methanoperedens sp.]